MTLFHKLKKQKQNFLNQVEGRHDPSVPDYKKSPQYKGNLDAALEYLADTLGRSDDFMVRVVELNDISAACVFINTICDHKAVEETLRSLHSHQFPRKKPKNLAQYLIERVLVGADALFMNNLFEIREALAAGSLVLFVDGTAPAIVMDAKYVEHRPPEQPFIEASSRGSQISFVENIDVNIGLIRVNLATDTLRVKKLKVGYRSRRNVAVLFIGDIANPVAIDTVVKRIQAIHIDMISGTAAVEQRISGHPWSLFPLVRTTQRIDNVCRELNQGKVVIVVDGDPTVMLAPATVQDFFQTEEDYLHSFWEATFVRWLRMIAFVLGIYLPALYISFVDYSPELLPKVLGLQIARSREGVPFPAVMEVVLMQVAIEILREATLRMPKQMGQTIGIVGGLVVGQASVDAGIVSNILIIVIAMTAISIFVSPSYEFTTVQRIGCWSMILASSIVGFYGVVLLSIWILFEVGNLKSFGISYLDPFNGEHVRDVFVDGLVRLPITVMDKRASHMHTQNEVGEDDYELAVRHPQLEKLKSAPKRKGRRKP